MMDTKMKMAKVIKITTHANDKGLIMEVVSAIDARRKPSFAFFSVRRKFTETTTAPLLQKKEKVKKGG